MAGDRILQLATQRELREVEVEVGRGKTILEAVTKIGVTEQTYSLGRRSSVGCGSTAVASATPPHLGVAAREPVV